DEVNMIDGRYRAAEGSYACIHVCNHSPYRLKVALFNASLGCVQKLGDEIIEGKSENADRGEFHMFWYDGNLGRPYPLLLQDGVDWARDRLVAIGRTLPDGRMLPELDLDYLSLDQTFDEVVQVCRGDIAQDKFVGQRRTDDDAKKAATERWTAAQAV